MITRRASSARMTGSWVQLRREATFLIVGLVMATVAVALVNPAAGSKDGASSWQDDLTPIGPDDWTRERAAHLLERAGFGGTPAQIDELAAMSPRAAVKRLVRFEGVAASKLPAFEHSGLWKPGMDPFPESRAEAVRQGYERGESMGVQVDATLDRPLQPIVDRFFYLLRGDVLEARRVALWWAERMLLTKRPLEEKMALFWHGHFATSDSKVRDYRKLLMQIELFQREGLGSFRDLLLAVTRDPGMLVYLDNGENRKDHPNENFGREVLELFTMGVGNYTEDDIREASRAFTGWTQEKLEFVVHEDQHDDGLKTVLGKKGRWDGEDVIDIIVAEPATARFVAAKIYRFFARDDLSPELAARLGSVLEGSNYDVAALLETIFLSRDFYSEASVGTQIKSPVQLLVSTYKKMGLERLPTIPDFNSATASLGQLLLHPPNVAGWAGGRSWITGASLLERGDLMRQVLFPDVEGFRPPDRALPGIYARVRDRLAQGMDITAATSSGGGASAFANLAGKSEDYNTRYGGYMGYVLAWEVVKRVPRAPAAFELTVMLEADDARSARAAVDSLASRFLRVELSKERRRELVAFAESVLPAEPPSGWRAEHEEGLRQLLHLLLSLPEYQLD